MSWDSRNVHEMSEIRKTYLKTLRRSRLFFPAWYLQSYPESRATSEDPLRHFYRNAIDKRYDPSPFFSTSFYLQQYGDVYRQRVNPLLHYVTDGYLEGRKPNSWFDPKTHLSQDYELKPGEVPLALFVELLTRIPPDDEILSRKVSEIEPLLERTTVGSRR